MYPRRIAEASFAMGSNDPHPGTAWTKFRQHDRDRPGTSAGRPGDRFRHVPVGRARPDQAQLKMNDLRFAIRQLAKSPGFTVFALITLAIAIGACTAIFSVVNGVLLRPIPYLNSDQLVVIRETHLPEFSDLKVAPGNFADWQRDSTSFAQLAADADQQVNLVGVGPPVHANGLYVTVNYLSTLGVSPVLGRDFRPEEGTEGHNNVAILTYRFWQQLGGQDDLLNRTVRLDGELVTIVGIMPPYFEPVLGSDILFPFAYNERMFQARGFHYLRVSGRLKAGRTLGQAQGELDLLAQRLAGQFPDTNKGLGAKLTPLLDYTVGKIRPQLCLLLGAVCFLLFIGCANIANLILVRASARSKEIAVRAAMGAGRARVVRQLLIEHLLLAVLGGLLGVLAAYGGLHLLQVVLAPDQLPRLSEATIDLRVLAFSFGLTLLTGIGFGIVPAYQATRVDLNTVFKDVGRGSGGGQRRQRLRSGLVVAELAIALLLLIGAGLLMRSFTRLLRVDPGFQAHSAMTFQLSLPYQKYVSDSQRRAFVKQLLTGLSNLPGVTHVGTTSKLPLQDSSIFPFYIAGKKPIHPSDSAGANYYAITPDYFKAMGIPLVRGREFTEHDSESSPRVAIINETIAKKFFPNGDPVGKRIDIGSAPEPEILREIIGIVADVKQYGLDIDPIAQVYEPFLQRPIPFFTCVVRTSGAGSGLPAAIRATVLSIDRDQPIGRIYRIEEFIAYSLGSRRFAMSIFAVFSAAALFLAGIGIYGVIAYSVTQRTGEIGVRMALGAQSRDVLKLILGQGAYLIVAGLAAGLIGALILARFIASMLYRTGTSDPLTLAAASVALALVAFAACFVPAFQATRVSPMVALRAD
jgi:putative ABC transport system permease protein